MPSVGSKLAAPVAPLEISVRIDQSLWLREGTASPVRVSADELVARVQARQAKNPDLAVVIAADRAVRYEEVVHVLDLLQREGCAQGGPAVALAAGLTPMPVQRVPTRQSATKWIAALLAIAVHVAFVLFLVFSVRWRNRIRSR